MAARRTTGTIPLWTAVFVAVLAGCAGSDAVIADAGDDASTRDVVSDGADVPGASSGGGAANGPRVYAVEDPPPAIGAAPTRTMPSCPPPGDGPNRPPRADGPPYNCTVCRVGDPCDIGVPCRRGVITQCVMDRTVCSDNGPAPVGADCTNPTGGVCNGANACVCRAGQSNCGGVCLPTGGACTSGTGACARMGTMVCSGSRTVCSAAAGAPGPETCNGVDDDCDGAVDESIPSTTCSPSACQTGSTYCSRGATQCAYTGNVAAGTPCPGVPGGTCDGVGNCTCPAGQTLCAGRCVPTGGACVSGTGACQRAGVYVCDPGGTATAACSATPGAPSPETCNGIDDDCNGIVDDLAAAGVQGLRGEYFDEPGFATRRITRLDASVNFDWMAGAPDPAVAPGTFSVRWTGQIVPRFSENYAFEVWSNDGVRLYIDGTLIVDNWTDHGPTTDTGMINLIAGRRYDIRLEYNENTGPAGVRLSWRSASQALEVVPAGQLYPTGNGLRGEYFDSPGFAPPLRVVRIDDTIDFAWGAGSPHPTIAPGTYSVRWTGQIVPAFSEAYTFYLTSADGVRLFIGAAPLISNTAPHALTTDSATVVLTAGRRYDIRVEYDEGVAPGEIRLEWSSASQRREVVPASALIVGAAPATCSVSDCRGGYVFCSRGGMSCAYAFDEAAGTPCTTVNGGVCDGRGACGCPAGQTNCSGFCRATGGACTSGVGACARAGTVVCSGTGTACSAVPGAPSAESCNGIDDNCNGVVDDITPAACTPGECRTGQTYCSGGRGPLCAYTGNSPAGTACASLVGGVCDGAGTCTCPGGQSNCGGTCRATGAACATGVGACRRTGTIVCSGAGTACNAVAGAPTAETCNGIDDNCDGVVDNIAGAACTVGVGACLRAGTLVCSGLATVCSATPGTPALEVCNGVDDNCDGATDNIAPASCNLGECRVGALACSGGSAVCQFQSNRPAGTPCTGGTCDGAGNCGCPAGQVMCGGVCRAVGGACTVGIGACARTGTMQCTAPSCTPGGPFVGSGTNGGSGARCSATYTFPVVAGQTYEISTCGSYTGDPYLVVTGACTCSNDDSCGLGSRCVCTATTTGNATICASTYASSSASWNYTVRNTSCAAGGGGGACAGPFIGSGVNGGSGARCNATYTFPVTAGQTYRISTCGSFAGDPYLVVTGACSCRNDDTCGLGAECTCTATTTGNATICASTFSSSSASWAYTVTSTACGGGTVSCSATAGSPTAEVCNGIDDDCDGATDEFACIPNDTCAGATALSLGAPGTVTRISGTTVGARHDMNGNCGAATTAPDLFYRFTLSQRSLVYIDGFGSGYDIVLFLSNACGATQAPGFACNDDACGTLQSQLVQVLDPGTYYLAVSGYFGSAGPFNVQIQHLPASNRVFGLPQGAGRVVSGNTAFATDRVGQCAGFGGRDDTYYYVTCPSYRGGSMNANTCFRAGWDTVLGFRQGNSGAFACNDDSCGLQSRISGSVTAGAGVRALYIDGYSSGAFGNYSIAYSVP